MSDAPPRGLVDAVIALAAAGAGVDHQRRAIAEELDRGGSATCAEVLARMRRELAPRLDGLDADVAAHVRTRLERTGTTVMLAQHGGYPPRLLRAWPELGAPVWLFARGSARWHDRPAVAIVGTRRPTADGLRTAEALAAAAAAAGAVVISGMARGIDQAAHRGALIAGGATVAVLGTGFGVDYPHRSADLRDEVAAAGALVTELAPGTPPRPHHFLARNRIIAGLADVTVVVEGRARSGALHTARMAAAQGRDVLAVPGSIAAPASRAPLDLIRDGAGVVTRVDDVVAALGLDPRRAAGVAPSDAPPPGAPFRSGDASVPAADVPGSVALPAMDARLLGLLGPAPTSVDELITRSGADAATVLGVVGRLRRLGLVDQAPQGLMARAGGPVRDPIPAFRTDESGGA